MNIRHPNVLVPAIVVAAVSTAALFTRCSNRLSASELFDLRTKCAVAAEVFERKYKASFEFFRISADFTSRYDEKQRLCLVEALGPVTSDFPALREDIRKVFDAQGGTQLFSCVTTVAGATPDVYCTDKSGKQMSSSQATHHMNVLMDEDIGVPTIPANHP